MYFSNCISPSLFDTPQCSFFCLVIWHQYHFNIIIHFSTISYSSIQGHLLVFQIKRIFEFLETRIHQCFKQQSHPVNFWKLPSKTSMLKSFLSALGSFSKSYSGQLFCRETVCSYFCKNKFHDVHYLKNFLEFKKNAGLKAAICMPEIY